jgi:hypothetical protein
MDDAVRIEREEHRNFRIRKRYGFEYSHRIASDGSDPPVIFSIQGPAIPKKKGVGLTFEVRF